MLPFFLESTVRNIRHWYDDTSEDFRWGLMIFCGIVLIVLTVASVTTITYVDEKGNKTCRTMLGEQTPCKHEQDSSKIKDTRGQPGRG